MESSASAGGANGRVTVVVVGHDHKAYLPDCIRALERAVGDVPARLVLVDNASTDGSADLVRSEILGDDGTATCGGLPCTFLANDDNRGFAGGNNQALEIALRDGDEFAYLLNPDTEVEPGFLAEAIDVAVADPSVGIVQSLLLHHPENERINTWGNELQFLGFGYVGGDGVGVAAPEAAGMLEVRDIAYASGAGMLVRTSLLREIGLLDDELFTYDEDLDLSWRARLAGHRIVLAPESVVLHKYEFSRGHAKYYWLERNRFLVLTRCYRIPTTLLILPALVAMEVGVWAFAVKSGWWREKARAYAYLASPRRWSGFRRKRRHTQQLRRVTDREATATFTGRVVFEQMQPALLTRVANPVFAAYWRLVRLVMFW